MQELMEGNKKGKYKGDTQKRRIDKGREIGLDRIPHFVKQVSYKVK
jgi:hypothetical protein